MLPAWWEDKREWKLVKTAEVPARCVEQPFPCEDSQATDGVAKRCSMKQNLAESSQASSYHWLCDITDSVIILFIKNYPVSITTHIFIVQISIQDPEWH